MADDQAIENEIQAKGLTAPRVTPADIEANIASEHYFTAYDGSMNSSITPGISGIYHGDVNIMPLGLLTFCVLVLRNGFTVTGESACASPENFDAEIGRKIARQNAVQKIWPLMGYALKERLASTATDGAQGKEMDTQGKLPEKVFKFQMPVGAVVGGFRHIGNGEFVGSLVDRQKLFGSSDKANLILEIVSEHSDAEIVRELTAEIVDDPLCEKTATLDFKIIRPEFFPETMEELKKYLDDFIPGEWHSSDDRPTKPGCYERECENPRYAVYSYWDPIIGKWFCSFAIDAAARTTLDLTTATDAGVSVATARWREWRKPSN